MTVFQNTHGASGSFVSAGRLSELTTNAFRMIAEWNNRRITRNALTKLSDRELDDIGLSRSDVADFPG